MFWLDFSPDPDPWIRIFLLIRIRILSTDSRMEAEDGPREEGIPRNNTTRNRTACAGQDNFSDIELVLFLVVHTLTLVVSHQ